MSRFRVLIVDDSEGIRMILDGDAVFMVIAEGSRSSNRPLCLLQLQLNSTNK